MKIRKDSEKINYLPIRSLLSILGLIISILITIPEVNYYLKLFFEMSPDSILSQYLEFIFHTFLIYGLVALSGCLIINIIKPIKSYKYIVQKLIESIISGFIAGILVSFIVYFLDDFVYIFMTGIITFGLYSAIHFLMFGIVNELRK